MESAADTTADDDLLPVVPSALSSPISEYSLVDSNHLNQSSNCSEDLAPDALSAYTPILSYMHTTPGTTSALSSPTVASVVQPLIDDDKKCESDSTRCGSRYPYVMLWSNIDALCWLDVLLCMLCNNNSLRKVSHLLPYSSVIKKLLLAYDESQQLIEPFQSGDSNIFKSVIEQDKPAVKRGE